MELFRFFKMPWRKVCGGKKFFFLLLIKLKRLSIGGRECKLACVAGREG